jgi:hypothetical protein
MEKSELLEKFESLLKNHLEKFPNEDPLINNEDDCVILKKLGFSGDVRCVFWYGVQYNQLEELNWNEWDEEMFSCPTYKKAIEWLKKEERIL